MSDIEKSFTYLQDNLPQWLQDIVMIEAQVTAMQDEVTRIAVSHSPFGKRRSGSIESIRPGKLDAIAEDAAPSNEASTDLIGSRKRKPPSVSSGRTSLHSRHRLRTMVVTTYDGDMQKSFELLVRAIGTARNMLRKAKMEARMNEMASQAESSEDEDDVDDEEEDVMLSRVNYRSRMSSMRARAAARRSGRLGVSSGSDTPAELFENTDKTLERAQELSEKAAHLTLRDGDCRKELEAVRKHFETLLETSKTEVDKCNAQKTQEPPELHAHDTSDTSVSSMDTDKLVDRNRELLQQAHKPPQKIPIAGVPPNTGNLEVDENDDNEEDDFVMPPIRITRRARDPRIC